MVNDEGCGWRWMELNLQNTQCALRFIVAAWYGMAGQKVMMHPEIICLIACSVPMSTEERAGYQPAVLPSDGGEEWCSKTEPLEDG